MLREKDPIHRLKWLRLRLDQKLESQFLPHPIVSNRSLQGSKQYTANYPSILNRVLQTANEISVDFRIYRVMPRPSVLLYRKINFQAFHGRTILLRTSITSASPTSSQCSVSRLWHSISAIQPQNCHQTLRKTSSASLNWSPFASSLTRQSFGYI